MGQYTMDSNTVALLHFENGLNDECGNNWVVAAGNPVIDTNQKAIGNSSLYIPPNAYLTSTNDKFALGSSDFTIDFWVRSATPNSCYFVSSSVVGEKIGVAVCGDGTWIGTNSTSYGILGMKKITSNTWAHIAVVRYQGEYMLFVDGKLYQKEYMNPKINNNIFAIGARYSSGNTSAPVDFYIDEFRISNIARWTSDFTPNEGNEEISAPTNLTATAGDAQVILDWNAVSDAIAYNVKRSTSAGGTYTTIANGITGTDYIDTAVVNGTTYYYVVTAVIGGTESGNSNEASATPQATVTPPNNESQTLRVTVIDSSDHDYQLTPTEVEGFVNWFMKHTNTDTAGYMLTKKLGSQSSKEYVAYDKIISFEVMELSK